MRKTLLTICVAALSLLAVSSCGKIWDEIDSLKAKVESLENKLNSEVAAINAALDVQLKFQVNPETYEVSVSYDNGATWVSTGIYANDATVEVVYEEGSDELTLVVDGTPYAISVYSEDAASIVVGRSDFFLRYEGVKKVELSANGISEFYVMAKPDGWKATVVENTLVVTAPTKAAVKIGAAETTGEILLHATTAEGNCKVAKVEVTAGPGLTLAVDAKGNITIHNSYASEKVSMWGDVSFGFSDFVFGLATPADFLADPVAYVETYNKTWYAPNYMDIILPSMYNMVMPGEYVEGEYETDVINTTVAEMYFNYFYEELVGGQQFVVWVAPVDASKEGAAIVEDVLYAEYVYLVHDVEVKEVSHSDATITANVMGASNYVIGFVAESDYNNDWNSMTFEEYMNSAMGGPWTGFKNYGAAEALGVVVPVEGVPAEFNLSDVMGQKLAFGENYKVWVMPLVDHKAILDEANSYPEEDYYVYDYSAFDFNQDFMPYVFDVKTNDIVAGGDYAVTLDLNRKDYTSIYVDVTLSEGTDMVYYAWYSPEDYEMFETDAEVMASLFENCYSPLTWDETVSKTYVEPGEEYYLATVSIGADGKYGEVVAEKFSTTAIPYDEAITVEVVSCVLDEDGKNYTVTVNVAGASKVMGYNITDSEYNQTGFPNAVCQHGHKASYYGYQMAEVVDGQAVFTFPYSSYKKDLYVAAYNVEDGAVSAISAEFAVEHLFD